MIRFISFFYLPLYLNNKKMKNIVFVADIADDIDDLIAIEYLAIHGYLKCLVLDGKSRSDDREKRLLDLGVVIENEIPKDTKIIFCGGALTKIADFIKDNEIDILVANGGFAGDNLVSDPLAKFKGKNKIRTYNFNMDVPSTLKVIDSDNIKEILLVSKNVCHNPLNVMDKIHFDSFLYNRDLSPTKLLHDLLMVKEGVNYLNGGDMLCDYENIIPTCDRKTPDNMSLWGSSLSPTSNIRISVKLNI